jgi:hypothetical protein
MATATIKQLSQTALTTTLTTVLYTVAVTATIMKEVVLCNTDTVDRQVTLYAGTGTGIAQRFLSAVNVPAGQTSIFTFSSVLPTGATIAAGASVGAVVSCTISGMETQ